MQVGFQINRSDFYIRNLKVVPFLVDFLLFFEMIFHSIYLAILCEMHKLVVNFVTFSKNETIMLK